MERKCKFTTDTCANVLNLQFTHVLFFRKPLVNCNSLVTYMSLKVHSVAQYKMSNTKTHVEIGLVLIFTMSLMQSSATVSSPMEQMKVSEQKDNFL